MVNIIREERFMKITYYGTAAAEGVPALFCECETCKAAKRNGGKDIRTRSQALIDDGLLIDFPADTYMHMLYGGLPLTKIAHCLITHAHSDHLYIDDFSMRGRGFAPVTAEGAETLHVYGSEMVKRAMAGELYCRFSQEKRVEFHQLSAFETYKINGYAVIPLHANHDIYAAPFIYIIAKDGKTLLYGNDTGIFPDATWKYLEKSGIKFDYVSLDCTSGIAPMNYDSHMNLERNLIVRDRFYALGLADDGTIFCSNHFSHNGGHILYDDFTAEASKHGFLMSYDGMSYEF